MAATEPSLLERFHRFVGKQLESETAASKTPEEVFALWRERQETISAIEEGLADVAAGRTKSLADYERDFRQRHGIEGAA